MKTVQKQIDSTNEEQTIRIAKSIGSQLKGGECIELIGDIGAGKTTFVKGLVKGAGSNDHVSSPTFTISKIYETPRFEIAHFDFYRLQNAELIKHELKEYVNEKEIVLVVEWSGVISGILPKERLIIELINKNKDNRTIKLCAADNSEFSFFN